RRPRACSDSAGRIRPSRSPGRRWPLHAMPHADHRRILSGMKGPTDPQHRPAAPDEFELVATGITALVAKRILETEDDAMSATKARSTPRGAQTDTNPTRSRPTRPAQSTAEDVLPRSAARP